MQLLETALLSGNEAGRLHQGPLKTAQMLGARRRATGAYMEVREDRESAGNNADGRFSEVPPAENHGMTFMARSIVSVEKTIHVLPVVPAVE